MAGKIDRSQPVPVPSQPESATVETLPVPESDGLPRVLPREDRTQAGKEPRDSSGEHEPTKELREAVERAAGLGLPQAMIAAMLGICADTLRRYYADELRVGKARATYEVARIAMQHVRNGDVAMCIFWLKTQAGWRETNNVELSYRDLRKLPYEELRAIAGLDEDES